MANINTTILGNTPALPAHQRVHTLHTFDHHRRHKVVRSAARSYFTDIYCSDTGIIGFLTPVRPFTGRRYFQGDVDSDLQEPGLFILSTQFDETKDWVIATEHASYGAEGKIHIILGENRFKEVEDIVQAVVSARLANRKRSQPVSKPRRCLGLISRFMDLRNGFDVVETPVIDDGYLASLPPTIDRFSLMEQPEPHLPQLKKLVYDE